MSTAATAPQPSLTYAGIGARFLAMIVDGLIVGCVGFVLVMVLGRTFGNLAYIVLAFGYGTMLESSEKQATFGKQMMSIRVTDLNGGRIDLTKAFIRQISKILSAIFFIGYIMAFFSEKKQGLHDLIAGTVVVK